MKKRALVLFIAFLLLINLVNADKINVISKKVDAKAFPGSDVLFSVEVKNNQLRDDIIKINPDPFSVYPFSDFIKNIIIIPSQLNIPAGKSGSFDVTVRYAKDIKGERAYNANIIVKSLVNNDVKKTHALTAFILSSTDIITMRVNLPESLVPGKENSFDVTFKNNVNQNFENIDFYITSSGLNEQHKISLKPNEQVTRSFNLNLRPELGPGKYNLALRVYKDQALKGEESIEFNVEQNKDLQEKISKNDGFLSSVVTISKINNGNINVVKNVKYPISTFQNWFTETSPKGILLEENDEKYLSWNLNIEPGRKEDITITTDYSSFFYSIFGFILLGGLIYYTKTRSLKISKKVVTVKEGKDKKQELKVIITVENYTRKPLNNIKIIDLLPSLIRHYKDFGTLEPKNVQQGSKGLRFIWEIPKLERGEERIISYKIEPQLNVYGNLVLPGATLQYTNAGNKIVARRSNNARFEVKKQ